ncbi:ribosomal RNA-processing protein 8 [Pancytospora philotis]|nr:ribosomal RNA-processing protein 8 [Pancytospora philotis]
MLNVFAIRTHLQLTAALALSAKHPHCLPAPGRHFCGAKNLPMSVAEELEKKLYGGKFRLLNEKMYKNQGLTAKEAQSYHTYYAEQAKKWPMHPKKILTVMLEEKGASELRIADLGCGSAELATVFPGVDSFDRYPASDKIIKADLASIPVEDATFDVAVHSLSLMASHISKIIRETNRVLKMNGEWYIAEVQSRIRRAKPFISDVEKFGFKVKEANTSNTYFSIFVFTKVAECPEGRLPAVQLKPCLYKRR